MCCSFIAKCTPTSRSGTKKRRCRGRGGWWGRFPRSCGLRSLFSGDGRRISRMSSTGARNESSAAQLVFSMVREHAAGAADQPIDVGVRGAGDLSHRRAGDGFGVILVVDLTVLGFGMRQPAERLARQVAPWGLAGLVVMIASGVPMFLSAAVTYSGSTPFAIKMTLLACGMGLQLGMHARSGMYAGSGAGKIAACLSLICWFGVAYAGRGIAFEVLFGTGG